MTDPRKLIADEAGALGIDRLCLIAAALLLLGMTAYELFDAGFGSLLSTVDPGVAAFTSDLELASSRDSAD